MRERALHWLVKFLPGRHLPKTPTAVAFALPWPGTHRGLMAWGLSLFLGGKAVAYILLGAPDGSDQALELLNVAHIPVRAAAVLMLAVAVYAALMSYCHHGRDRYAFTAITGFSWAWAGLYYATPLALDGSWSTAFQGGWNFFGIGFLSIVCAAFAEPIDPDRTCGVTR